MDPFVAWDSSRSVTSAQVRRSPYRVQYGQSVDLARHKFFVVTGNVSYTWTDSSIWFETGGGGYDKEMHRALGYRLERFIATDASELLLLHAPGNALIA